MEQKIDEFVLQKNNSVAVVSVERRKKLKGFQLKYNLVESGNGERGRTREIGRGVGSAGFFLRARGEAEDRNTEDAHI